MYGDYPHFAKSHGQYVTGHAHVLFLRVFINTVTEVKFPFVIC